MYDPNAYANANTNANVNANVNVNGNGNVNVGGECKNTNVNINGNVNVNGNGSGIGNGIGNENGSGGQRLLPAFGHKSFSYASISLSDHPIKSNGHTNNTNTNPHTHTQTQTQTHKHTQAHTSTHTTNHTNTTTHMKEPPIWVPDRWAEACAECRGVFNHLRRRHHCRACGKVFCGKCTREKVALPEFGWNDLKRVCVSCYMDRVKKGLAR